MKMFVSAVVYRGVSSSSKRNIEGMELPIEFVNGDPSTLDMPSDFCP